MLRSLPSLPALGMGPSLDDRSHSPLPPIGHDISRPSSTSTQNSNVLRHQQIQQNGLGNNTLNLPGMSALASVAASSHSPQMRSFSGVNQSLNYATPSPTPTSVGGQGNNPPICQNCQTSTTPLWRRDELGSVLCNACGLFLKLHNRPRPISLKTDVIKSRNRVKSSGQAIKKAAKALLNGTGSRSEAGTPPPPGLRRVSGKSGSDRSISPISRTQTPALHHPSAVAPGHGFDTSHLPDHILNHSQSLPALSQLRQPSPGSIVSLGDRHLELPPTYEGLQTTNAALKTRVSELEVINGLFKGRIQDLEQAEAVQHQALEQSRAREGDMRRRLDELEHYVAELRRDSPNVNASKRKLDDESLVTFNRSPPESKRTRLSDLSTYPESPKIAA